MQSVSYCTSFVLFLSFLFFKLLRCNQYGSRNTHFSESPPFSFVPDDGRILVVNSERN